MKKAIIKFGTDGWRAKIADDFTFENVQIVTQAFVNYLKEAGPAEKAVAVGYDNRFESEIFARIAAEICSGAGIRTLLSSVSIPSPALSYTVKDLGLAAGIMITASHNPPEWNGFKIKESFGGSSFPETTKAVEAKLLDKLEIVPSSQHIEIINPIPNYLKKIASLVDLEMLKNSKLKMAVDPMHGSGAGLFKQLGLDIIEIRGKRDPLFSGINPEPLPVNLADSISFTRNLSLKYSQELCACLVLDGDADRIAAIDGSGIFINTHNIFELLLRHLVLHRKMTGNVVKTFNMSNLIDKLCQQYNRQLDVTPIGFKYIAAKMLKEDILLGGEESGGMGIKGFIPERDGTLAGLMLMELMAYEKMTLGQILAEIMQEHGHYFYSRSDLYSTKGKEMVENLKNNPPTTFAGKTIAKIATLDGLKFSFEDDSWILFRASGTEPLLRIYVEARTEEAVKILLGTGEQTVH